MHSSVPRSPSLCLLRLCLSLTLSVPLRLSLFRFLMKNRRPKVRSFPTPPVRSNLHRFPGTLPFHEPGNVQRRSRNRTAFLVSGAPSRASPRCVHGTSGPSTPQIPPAAAVEPGAGWEHRKPVARPQVRRPGWGLRWEVAGTGTMPMPGVFLTGEAARISKRQRHRVPRRGSSDGCRGGWRGVSGAVPLPQK